MTTKTTQEKHFNYSHLLRPTVLLFVIFQMFVLGFFVGYAVKTSAAQKFEAKMIKTFAAHLEKNKPNASISPTSVKLVAIDSDGGFKTYTNNDLNFSLRYPSNFPLTETHKYFPSTFGTGTNVTIGNDESYLSIEHIFEGTGGGGNLDASALQVTKLGDYEIYRTKPTIPQDKQNNITYRYVSKVEYNPQLNLNYYIHVIIGQKEPVPNSYSIIIYQKKENLDDLRFFDEIVKSIKSTN